MKYERHSFNFSIVTIPSLTSTTSTTGTSKETPKARNMVMTKDR